MNDSDNNPPPSSHVMVVGEAGKIGSPAGEVSRLQMSEAVRAERNRCADIARRHLNTPAIPNSDEDAGDLVAQGYANAALNILHEISGPGFTRTRT